jgi:Dyp-type peroxidase family
MTDTLELDDIQGLLARGYGKLREAALHLLTISDPRAAGGWLEQLADHITTATGSTPTGTAVNVAFTASGLAQLGLPAAVLEQFSTEFRGGMTTPHRRRVLGDVDGRTPEDWLWGGPRTPRVDLVVLLYASSPQTLATLERRHVAGADGVTPVRRLDTETLNDREHFGFRDGISQPAVRGLGGDGEQAIRAGEFVLGYRNEYGRYTGRPRLDPDDDPAHPLPPDPEGGGRVDLGRNGSYLVLRQLSQDVPGFWRFMDRARSNGAASPEALAARFVGRWPSGAPLVLAPERDDPELGARRYGSADDFGYAHLDADGLRCPLGAHIRRANPRDSLDPNPGSEESLAVNRRHRLIRRGRTYGPRITPEQALAEEAGGGNDVRGLHFACLCANLARQFEFVQHTWINNPKFNGLYEDPDPLIGPAGGALTIQARPVRDRLTGLPEFVSVRGGAYFFLPGLRALRYLAAGPRRR